MYRAILVSCLTEKNQSFTLFNMKKIKGPLLLFTFVFSMHFISTVVSK